VSKPEHAYTGPDVRMNVKVSRRDFPLLAEEIARLPKGPRRTNRLAHLATLGLCWERAVAGMAASLREPSPELAPLSSVVVPPVGDLAQPYRSRLDAGQLAALLDGGDEP
jgi:hypothetical protein